MTAYNEQKNIGVILGKLLELDRKCFRLDQIVVVSDGSTDLTIPRAREVESPYILIVDGTSRIGKPARLNQIFNMVQSDILVIIDADLTLGPTNMIDELIQPLISRKNVLLTAGLSEALVPHNIVQKIAKKGVEIWLDILDNTTKSDLYYCGGQIRAFGRDLYKKMIFPDFSADDSYSYLSCKKLGYDFAYVPTATTYYKLPSSFIDYTSQTLRYIRSEDIQIINFDEKIVGEHYVVGLSDKMKVLLRHLLSDFLLTSAYVIVYFCIRLFGILFPEKDKATWNVLETTK